MSESSAGKLYTPDLLSLATELAGWPLKDELNLRSEARSRNCGSSITLGLNLTENSKISDVGMQVSACAIGQASSAILARHAVGLNAHEVVAVERSVAQWLMGDGEMPDWPDFHHLLPAQQHKGRHGALILPWNALSQALSKVGIAG
ncbi:MAG: iron-sulfur cluster assembly scaffold protein [Erythrobacter sp.]